jgi:hypothetical protein
MGGRIVEDRLLAETRRRSAVLKLPALAGVPLRHDSTGRDKTRRADFMTHPLKRLNMPAVATASTLCTIELDK